VCFTSNFRFDFASMKISAAILRDCLFVSHRPTLILCDRIVHRGALMTRMKLGLWVGAAASVAVMAVSASCSVASQIGKPCTLVKGAPDGGTTPVLPGDITQPGTTDIITFGASDCEDQVCVLDEEAVPAALAAAGTTGPITGYCTTSCAPGTSTCSQQYNNLQNTAGDKMSCRALVLDSAALAALCGDGGSPALCAQLGGGSTPYYCARGKDVNAILDAGH
jgi:hypothetical protein